MSKKVISEIKIIYNINKENEEYEDNEGNMNIFGAEFVKNNNNIYKMEIDNCYIKNGSSI